MNSFVTFSAAVAVTALIATGCGADRSNGPHTIVLQNGRLTMQAGDSQIGAPGAAVPIRPAVRFVDEHGNPVQGVEVRFAVGVGGGSATGTEVLSDTTGSATVGSWILGPAAGKNTMTAVVAGVDADTVLFTAIALCDCWKAQASLNVGRIDAGAAVVNGKLYVVGGRNYQDASLPVEEYDPATNIWTARSLLSAHDKIGVAALGERIYAVGGEYGDPPWMPWLKSYDPVTDQWTQHAAPATRRTQLELVAIGGRLYALGGYSGDMQDLNTVEAYDPETNTWTLKTPMSKGRRVPAVAVVNGILYVMGGETNGAPGEAYQVTSSVESYDPATNTWTNRAPLPVPLMEAAAGVVGGTIYVGGGGPFSNNGKPYVYAYDPAKNAWTIQPPLRIARSSAMAVTLDGRLYEIGGWQRDTGVVLSSVEVFQP
jgi:N-acetylneuraminic acid mutarotase